MKTICLLLALLCIVSVAHSQNLQNLEFTYQAPEMDPVNITDKKCEVPERLLYQLRRYYKDEVASQRWIKSTRSKLMLDPGNENAYWSRNIAEDMRPASAVLDLRIHNGFRVSDGVTLYFNRSGITYRLKNGKDSWTLRPVSGSICPVFSRNY